MSPLARQLAELLSHYPQFELAILFGSQATGTASASSDIDLAIRSDQPIPADLKLELLELIGARFGRPVDIVDLHVAAEPVLGEVLKGQRLLGSDESYARMLTTHLFNLADFVPLQQRILAERRHAWMR
jgi:predicted nucleotidyltransferase